MTFKVDDSVLLRDDPRQVYRVISVDHDASVVAQAASGATLFAPEEHLVAAPEGWREPPPRPAVLGQPSSSRGLVARQDAYDAALARHSAEVKRWLEEVERPFLEALGCAPAPST